MKITDVKITPPLGRQNRNWVLMKVFTDEGIVGLGEYPPGAGSSAGLKRMMVGKDRMNINKLHYDHLMGMRGVGAGIEIALWDIKGKKLGVPMHQLLGGKIRMYCDCHAGDFWTGEDYARRWREVRETGVTLLGGLRNGKWIDKESSVSGWQLDLHKRPGWSWRRVWVSFAFWFQRGLGEDGYPGELV